MQLRYVIRRTGNKCFDQDTGLDYLEEETVLQSRESDNDEWQDVPTIDITLGEKNV